MLKCVQMEKSTQPLFLFIVLEMPAMLNRNVLLMNRLNGRESKDCLKGRRRRLTWVL